MMEAQWAFETLFANPILMWFNTWGDFNAKWYRMWYKICTLLGYYAASNCNLLLTVQDSVSVPSSRVKNLDNVWVPSSRVKNSWTSWPLEVEPIRCPKTSVKDYHSTLCNTPDDRRSHWHGGRSLKSQTGCNISESFVYCYGRTKMKETSCFLWPGIYYMANTIYQASVNKN
jgi:hypothetical protein